MMKLFFIVLFIFNYSVVFAQIDQDIKGSEELERGNYVAAKTLFKQASNSYEANKNFEQFFKAELNIALCNYYLLEYDSIIFRINNILNEYPKEINKDLASKVDFLGYLGLIHGLKKDYSTAYQYYKQALAVQKGMGIETKSLADIHASLATVCVKRGDFRTAIKYQKESIKLDKKLNNQNYVEVFDNYMGLGIAYYLDGRYNLAKDAYYKAKVILLKNEAFNYRNKLRWRLEESLGLLHNDLNNFDSAIYYHKHNDIYTKDTDNVFSNFEIADSRANLAKVYRDKKDVKLAKFWLYNSLEYANKSTYKSRDYAKTYSSLAQVFIYENRFDSAIYYSHQAIINFLPFFKDENIYSSPDLEFTNNEDALKFALHRKARAFLGLALQTKSPKDQEMTVN
ncbi:MAG: tetratricopeptide repeat protein, partial [Flammeovirgaceae bacterium]